MPTMRETMEAHHTNPSCAPCHQIFEPIGLALENFDAVGAWRTQDEGVPIDAAGVLVDGPRWTASRACATRWCAVPIRFARVVTEKLLTYALGRGVEYQDMPLVRSIVQRRGGQQLQVLVARAGHRQEPCVPDEHEDARCHAATSGQLVNLRRDIQTCLSRRNTFPAGPFCAAPARRWRCRCSKRWCRPRRRWRKRRPAPKPRFVGCFVPHGMAPGYWVPEQGRRGLRASVQLEAARAVPRSRDDSERPAFPVGRTASGRDRRRPLGGGGVPVREQAEEDRRRGRVRRHDDRSDDRAEDRPG